MADNTKTTLPRYHIKIILCGTGGVGKTALVRRYVEDKFEGNYLLTVGMEPTNKIITVDLDGQKAEINMLIYDVAGQERFQTLRDVFFRGANAALFVFDRTAIPTIEELEDWHRQLNKRLTSQIPIYLLGNKSDLTEDIEVEDQNVEFVKNAFKISKYYETSALSDINVKDAFESIALEALLNLKRN